MPLLFLRRGLWYAIVVAVLSLQLKAATGELPPDSNGTHWPLTDQEIPRSPRITWGRLENGLNYAILPHPVPQGRVSLRLLVRAGSLHENDDERGYAHFVEHMAFNGTKHFPAGDLVKFLQRQGAEFGPHVNAMTTHTGTLYKLDLPDSSAANVETGVRILRDFADGIQFASAEIKRERGVLHSEERSRRSPAEAEQTAFTQFVFNGTGISARHPLGTPESIENATKESLRRFYDAWYRPERMAVIVVGDINGAQTEALLRREFVTLVARAPARPEPEFVPPTTADSETPIRTHGDQGAGIRISLTDVRPRPVVPNTFGAELANLRTLTAAFMLRKRLDHLQDISEPVISDSEVTCARDYLRYRRFTIAVNTSVENWPKALATAEQELRRAVEFGFDQSELEWQQHELRRRLNRHAQGVSTLGVSMIADELAGEAENETMSFAFVDEQLLHHLEIVDRLTLKDCHEALRELIENRPLSIFLSGTATRLPSIDDIRAAYEASRAVPVVAAKPTEKVTFAYESFGQPGAVVEKRHIADLDLWLVRFENGVRLNLKSTPHEKGLVRFRLRFGTGRFHEPADKPGLAFWVFALWFGGTGKHPYADFNRMNAGLDGFNIAILDDSFMMSAIFDQPELPAGLRQLTSVFADPAFRTEGWPYADSMLRGITIPLWTSPEGAVQQLILPPLGGLDPRVGVPGDHLLYSRTLDELRPWLAPQVASGPMEIAIVGDFNVDAVIAELSKTFGALPPRESKVLDPARARLNFPVGSLSTYAFYPGADNQPSTLAFFWPVRDPLNATERRHLQLLADILENRVADKIREKKGATYSPNGFLMWNDTYPGFNFVRCILDVQPEKATTLGDAVRDLAAQLAQRGVKQDELARMKAQHLAHARAWETDNDGWLEHVLADAQQRPWRIDDARSRLNDIESATVPKLNELARRYLGADKPFRFIIDPNVRMPKK